MIERWLAARRAALRAAVPGLLLLGGVTLAPIALPLLPLQTTDRIIGSLLGWAIRPSDLTLELHEEHGWPEQARAVASVLDRLPPRDRAGATILTARYTEASAINLYGPRAGLPAAVSGHMTYYLWGPGRPAPVVIAYGFQPGTLERAFGDVQPAGLVDHPLASAWERRLPIYVCRAPRRPLAEMWPDFKRYRFRL